MVKNQSFAKSINDASWYQFCVWIEYFAKVFLRVTVAVNPQYSSQECSSCGEIVKKLYPLEHTYVCVVVSWIEMKTQLEISLVEDWVQ